jgi:hypothetical protein
MPVDVIDVKAVKLAVMKVIDVILVPYRRVIAISMHVLVGSCR